MKTISRGRFFSLSFVLTLCLAGTTLLAISVRPEGPRNLKANTGSEPVRVDSKAAKATVTVQAAGQGGSSLNLQSRQELRVDYRGDQNVIQAMQSGQAKACTLASADIDGDSAPDLLAGYTYGGIGIVTIQRGNSEAFAPRDESVYSRMHQGYNPDSLVPTAQTYQVPEPADFLQAGDFNNDSHADVLVGAQGRDLFLLAGDGQGNLAEAVQITLPGVVTAVGAGQFRAPDGWTDLAVGIDGPSGPQVLIYDGADGVTSEPMRLALASPATALEFGEVDDSPFMGLAIATGSEINVVHGWGRKQSPQLESRVERIDTGMNVRGLASGFFMWSREGSKQLAALGDDGTIRIFGRGQLNTQPLTEEELTARGRLRLQPKNTTPVDVEMLNGWQSAQAEAWTKSLELVTGKFVGSGATTQNLLRGADISFNDTDDLLVLGGDSKLDIIHQVDTTKSAQASASLIGGDFTTTSLDAADAPATLALPRKLNGWRDLVVMEAGSVSPTIVPLAPTATITVDRTDDPAITGSGVGAAACTAAVNDCSLRGAVEFANSNSGTVISLSTATYVLTTNGTNGCLNENSVTGNRIGDLEVNATTTINGTGEANSIIRQGSAVNDRVFCLDVTLTAGRTYAFSGLTITGGRDNGSNVGGGGIIGGAKGTTLNLTNVTFANNQTTGPATSGGGGVGVTGGDMNVTDCIFGAANDPGANKNDLTLGNAANSLSGGGLAYSAGDPLGTNGATGALTITGTTFTHNTSSSVSAGGGGLNVYEFNVSVGTGNISTSAFTSNAATGTASGGGIINQSMNSLTIATTSFTSNSAGNRGGGLYVGGGLGTFLNGTTPSITFTSNTAVTAGSSISAAGAVTASGTNTTIGGDLEITTNGTWTNSAGSVISPTNFIMTGTANFIGNNSTTNVGGNFNFGSGTFNAGTSTFNFNGSAPAQSITNASAITFFNLTDSNTTNPLTLNNSLAVSGTLSINGANAILAPVAAAVISGGTGTLTGTGTARVTKTGADSFFTQYTMPTRTLTNLTVEYIGAAAQTASVTTYNVLKINNGSGVSLGAGTTTVNSTLLLTAGALAVGANTLVIDNGITVGTGSLTSATTGTVNYNQGSASQGVITANYGNLTFSAFTKVLASSGTIGIAGTFNPNGVTSGHTITGSTIDFNGTGAQTVPVFDYNNLTISGARTTNSVTLASGTINVLGNFTSNATFTSGAFVVTGNTVNFNGSGAQNLNGTATSQAFNNFTVNKSGGTLTVGGSLATLNIGGVVTLTAGGFNAGTATSIVMGGGDWTNNGGAFTPGTSTATFNNTAATQTITGSAASQTFNNITVNKTAQVLNASGSTTTLTLNGTMNISSGVFNVNTASNVNVGGDWTLASGATFTAGGGTNTVTFNGGAAQALNGTATSQTFNNFTVNKGGGTLSGGGALATLTINKDFTLTAGTFAPGATLLTINESGGNWSNTGTFTAGTGTVIFNANAVTQTLSGSTTFNNLTINHTGAGNVDASGSTLTVGGLLRIQAGTFVSASTFKDVQIDSGQTLQGTNATTMNVSGNWTNNGGTFTPSGNTVNFNGAGAQSINGTAAAQTFNNVIVAKTGGSTLNTGGSTTSLTANDLTLTSGIFAAPAAVDVNGNVLLTAGTLTAGANMTVAGSWTNNGATFTGGAGTVTFDGGAGQTIGGTTATAFTNLTNSDAGGIAMNNDNTVNGILALTSSDIIVAATKTLTQPVGGSSSGTFDVNGRLQRNGFVTGGAALSFGNPFNSIQVTAGTAPANIVVDLTRSVPTGGQGFPTAVQRTYTITPSTTAFTATIRLHYRTAELNSNDPAALNLWRFDSGINQWRPNAATSRDCAAGCTTNNSNFWAEKTGVTTFSPWTLNSTVAPSAAPANVSGRITDPNGLPISNALVQLSGPVSRTAWTDRNGNYHFDDLATGEFYTLTPSLTNYQFTPASRSFSLVGNMTDAGFTGVTEGRPGGRKKP